MDNRGAFILFLVFFMLFSPAGNPSRILTDRERQQLEQYFDTQTRYVNWLNTSSWRQSTHDLAGFKEYPEQAAFNGSLLPKAIYDHAMQIWTEEATQNDPEKSLPDWPVESPLTYFTNISGIIKGEWERINSHIVPIDMTIPTPAKNHTIGGRGHNNDTDSGHQNEFANEFIFINPYKEGNVTENQGYTQMTIQKYPSEDSGMNVSTIAAELTLYSEGPEPQHTVALRGLYIKPEGNVVLITDSLKFAGSYGLPHLLLDETYFEEAKDIMVKSLNQSLNAKKRDPYYGIIQEAERLAENCEYIIYGHIRSTGLTPEEVQDIEDELKYPLGRPHRPTPPLRLQASLYSPDCAIGISTVNAKGEKEEQYYRRVRNCVLAGTALLLIQTVVLTMQMKDTSTPSTISRISFISVALTALVDGAVCMTALVMSFMETVALAFLAVAFVAFILTVLFELRYLTMVYRSQLMESIADARAREALNERTRQNESDTRTEPRLPMTERPAMPVVEQDERQISGMIYSRYYLCLLGFLILSVTSTSWPLILKRGYEYLVLFFIYSLWLPQIYRNIVRGSRKAFLWRYVIVTSCVRLIPVLYVFLVPANIVDHRYGGTFAAIICCYVWFQICLLVAQSIFGPRFFIPRGTYNALYDYHPVITEEDLETGFNFVKDSDNPTNVRVGLPEAAVSLSDGDEDDTSLLQRKASVDCAICMNPVEVVILPKNKMHIASTPANILARRKYMVTPCKHVFHSDCMEQWMRTRLQCPVCRNPLPPI